MDGSESVDQTQPVEIIAQSVTLCIASLADGQHFVGGDVEGKIRYWQVQDGREMGSPMDAGSAVHSIATSQDGKWIVTGTEDGRVILWDAKSRQKVDEFTPHEKTVNAVDISPDGTKIASTSDDRKAAIRLREGGKFLFGRRDRNFHTIKFSPNSRLTALAYSVDLSSAASFCTFDSQDGNFLGIMYLPVQSIAWASDSRLFALCSTGDIHYLDVISRESLYKWRIHSNNSPKSIALSRNGAFIVASANSSVSFWDTSTHAQIGPVVHHLTFIDTMAISQNNHLVISGGFDIASLSLHNVLSIAYIDVHTRCKKTEADLNRTIEKLQIQLADTQRTAKQRENVLETTVDSVRVDLAVQNSRSMDLGKMVEDLRAQLANSHQKAKNMLNSYQRKHGDLEKSIEELRIELANSQEIVRIHRQKHECESLYANSHIIDAAKLLFDIRKRINDIVETDTLITDWLSGFTNKCIIALEEIGDKSSGDYEQALAAYATALSISSSSPHALLAKWASTLLLRGSTKEVLDRACEFDLSKFVVYRALCDVLEREDRVTEAIECFRQAQPELTFDMSVGDERQRWELDFRRRCRVRLEKRAGTALDSQSYNEAVEHFTTILSLDPPDRVGMLVKRGKTRIIMKLWEDALEDADEVIKLDPSSYRGYELRHAALHGTERHREAVVAIDTMLSKLEEHPDPRVRELRSRYVDARPAIRRLIHNTISHMPRVLIDTTTGRLIDRIELTKAFEAFPTFNKLVSSMTQKVDHAWILREVKEFYRYAMFSHKWEDGEPLLQEVKRITIYKLEVSSANIKLQRFCSVAQSLGFRWAWSDTCCIDKLNNVILQESLVAMFAWYRDSTLTIIHLCDVSSLSDEPDGLLNSIWNSRVWTYQEYAAAKRVQFYTQDWKPYRGLTLENHKESPEVLREMEVPQVSAEQVAILEPGLDRVREKLYLASRRETTLVEDIAYSLLGIFHAPIPVIYGEGTRAVGRLLEYVLTGSGDVAILAWTGTANEYNSCLPLNLTVYNPLVPPHIPIMDTAQLDQIVTELHSSLPDLSPVNTLYNKLNGLPSVSLVSSRLRLPCIQFPITQLVHSSGPDPKTSVWVYHATTPMLGETEIQTTQALTTGNGHCLVHPWIRPLLSQEYARDMTGLDKTTRALRLVARLRQAFGALLFEKVSWAEYRRVAADSLIMVRIRDEVSLTDLIENVETIEVL